MTDTDIELCYLTATEALKKFKERTLSPLELINALISRTEKINPSLNAITYKFFDRAVEEAKKAESTEEQEKTAEKVESASSGSAEESVNDKEQE